MAQLLALFVERNRTRFEAPRIPTVAAECAAYVEANGGFLGPYLSYA